jgi:hypothetical protein
MKIANKDARQYVQSLQPFQGNNLFAGFKTQNNADGTNGPDMWYVVYSYGNHWPLFVHANGVWYENADKYGPTTSKHRTQSHPLCSTTLLSVDQIKTLADRGFQALAKQRVMA